MSKGGYLDHRPGQSNDGGIAFTIIGKPEIYPHGLSRVEIVAGDLTGMVRLTVAHPLGSKAVEVLRFSDPTTGNPGPSALQIHNAGLLDEYKDGTIVENPRSLDLVTIA